MKSRGFVDILKYESEPYLVKIVISTETLSSKLPVLYVRRLKWFKFTNFDVISSSFYRGLQYYFKMFCNFN